MGDQPTMPIPETPDTPSPDATQVMPTAPGSVGAPPATPPAAPPGAPAPHGDGPGNGNRRTTLLLVAIVVAILVIGACGAAYIIQKRRADDLETRVTEAEQQVQELIDGSEEPTTDAEGDTDTDADDSDADADEAGSDGDETGGDDDGEPAPGTEDGQYIGLITDIYNIEQSRWIEIDYIQFLTGDEAAAAAAARGDESPPPNDYYIVNENPMLRDFNVRSGLAVTMWTWNIETDGVTEQQIPFDIWWDEIEMHEQTHYLGNPYWITIDNGTVIEIEEQYLP